MTANQKTSVAALESKGFSWVREIEEDDGSVTVFLSASPRRGSLRLAQVDSKGLINGETPSEFLSWIFSPWG
tara:strand:- start:1115 stop:1330 length:216 start_codon:yes stop_codon:yes gene_type:complete